MLIGNEGRMRIAEIFCSIQGEGLLTGIPSVFVRTSGCNLRCWFCDSDYTSWHPEGDSLSVPEILERIGEFPVRHAVITGGEPMIAPGIEELTLGLRGRGYHITLETAATVFKPIECDLASLSPKLASSTPIERDGGRHAERHESLRLRPDVIRTFMECYPYQLKFVIDRPTDIDEVRTVLAALPSVDPERVLLMPQGVAADELRARGLWLVEECKRLGFRYCPRLHIDLYGNRRGT
jgi:7-carboxy-7-deazaguanine synthase